MRVITLNTFPSIHGSSHKTACCMGDIMPSTLSLHENPYVLTASECLAELFCWDYIIRELFSLPNSAFFLYLAQVVLSPELASRGTQSVAIHTNCGFIKQTPRYSWIPPHPTSSEDTFTGSGKPRQSLAQDGRTMLKFSLVMNWDDVLIQEKSLTAVMYQVVKKNV